VGQILGRMGQISKVIIYFLSLCNPILSNNLLF